MRRETGGRRERTSEGRFHPGLLPLAGDGQTVKWMVDVVSERSREREMAKNGENLVLLIAPRLT